MVPSAPIPAVRMKAVCVSWSGKRSPSWNPQVRLVKREGDVKLVFGVIANPHLVEDRFPVQVPGERNLRAVAEIADALPLMFASAADIIGTLLEVIDGVLLTGACAMFIRSVSAPSPSCACVDRGLCRPRRLKFRVCRGLQEMNAAFGSSFHPRDPRVASAHAGGRVKADICTRSPR
jgi:hypothetical protein